MQCHCMGSDALSTDCVWAGLGGTPGTTMSIDECQQYVCWLQTFLMFRENHWNIDMVVATMVPALALSRYPIH